MSADVGHRGAALSTVRLALQRARAGGGLLLSVLALIAVTTAIITGTVGYSLAAATVSAREAISDVDNPTEAGLLVLTRVQPDAATQDAAARALFDQAFAPADVVVQRSLVSDPRPVDGREERLVAISDDNLTPQSDLVALVDGAWPTADASPLQGALHADAAQIWGLSPGAVISVSGQDVRISALWRPADPAAAYWFDEPLARAGQADGEVGPLIVATDEMAAFSDPPFVRWTIQPDADALQPDDLAPIATAAQTLRSTLKSSDVELRGVQVNGDLAPTAAAAAQNLAIARALGVVPLLLLFGVCLIALVQLAKLLVVSRTSQFGLFLARGAARRQVIGWSVLEALALSVTGGGVGVVAAGLVLAVSVPSGSADPVIVIAVGALTGLAVVAVLTTVSVTHVRRLATHQSSDLSGRRREVAAGVVVVAVLGLAGLSWWQLQRYGSPVIRDAQGKLDTDLLAGSAPTFLLTACAVIALAALGPLSRLAQTVARRHGLAGHLATTQVSRQLSVYAVPVVLIVLSMGTATVAGMYAATSSDLRASVADLGQGSDVRVVLEQTGADEGDRRAIPEVSGVEAVSPVWVADTQVGDSDAQVVVAPMARWGSATDVPAGAADPAELADVLSPVQAEGIPLPTGAEMVQVDVDWQVVLPAAAAEAIESEFASLYEGLSQQAGVPADEALAIALEGFGTQAGGFELTLALRDTASGRISTFDAGSTTGAFVVDADTPEDVQIDITPQSTSAVLELLPDTAYEVVALDVSTPTVFTGSADPVTFSADITMNADGAAISLARAADGWAQMSESEDISVEQSEGGLIIDVVDAPSLSGPDGRMDSSVAVFDSGGQVPVALSAELAHANSLSVGSRVDLESFGAVVGADVVQIVDAVPGFSSPHLVVADSAVLSVALHVEGATLPAADEVWVSSAEPTRTAAEIAALPGIVSAEPGEELEVTDPARAVRLVFWAASVGAVLLAGIGVAAVVVSNVNARRAEVAVLRALGMTPRAQARSRLAELVGVLVAATVFGGLAGWAVSLLVVPDLARSTIPQGVASIPATLSLATGPWLVVLGLMVAILAFVGSVLVARVRAQALDADYREEVR